MTDEELNAEINELLEEIHRWHIDLTSMDDDEVTEANLFIASLIGRLNKCNGELNRRNRKGVTE